MGIIYSYFINNVCNGCNISLIDNIYNSKYCGKCQNINCNLIKNSNDKNSNDKNSNDKNSNDKNSNDKNSNDKNSNDKKYKNIYNMLIKIIS
jgi:hypothetical protein